MALFNVIAPCVIDNLHYVHPTRQPVEVDDEVAAELVKAGALEPYPKPLDIPGDTGTVLDGVVSLTPDLDDDVSTASGQPVRGPRNRKPRES